MRPKNVASRLFSLSTVNFCSTKYIFYTIFVKWDYSTNVEYLEACILKPYFTVPGRYCLLIIAKYIIKHFKERGNIKLVIDLMKK